MVFVRENFDDSAAPGHREGTPDGNPDHDHARQVSLQPPHHAEGHQDATAEAPRAQGPLPGEPGFKAPLTKKQADRAQQTIKGMVISTVLVILVVIPVMLLNPANKKNEYDDRVDVAKVAQQTEDSLGFRAVAPTLPDDWYVNYARWKQGSGDGVGFWDLGIVIREEAFAGVKQTQTKKANDSWLTMATDGSVPTGENKKVGDVTWAVRSTGRTSDQGKVSWIAKIHGYTYVITMSHEHQDQLPKVAQYVQKAARSQ